MNRLKHSYTHDKYTVVITSLLNNFSIIHDRMVLFSTLGITSNDTVINPGLGLIS